MSKTLTVTVRGEDAENPEAVLGLISKQISEGFTSGFDRNDTSSYEYSLDEEHE